MLYLAALATRLPLCGTVLIYSRVSRLPCGGHICIPQEKLFDRIDDSTSPIDTAPYSGVPALINEVPDSFHLKIYIYRINRRMGLVGTLGILKHIPSVFSMHVSV